MPSAKLTYSVTGVLILYGVLFGLVFPALLNIPNDFVVGITVVLFLGLLVSIPYLGKKFLAKYEAELKANLPTTNTTSSENK